MSRKERHRLVILGQVREGYKSLKLAAKQMQLCYRQAKRVWKQFREHGETGLVHRGRGKTSNRQIAAARREAIVGDLDRRWRWRRGGLGSWCSWMAVIICGLRIGVIL